MWSVFFHPKDKGEIDTMVNTQVLQGQWNQVRGQLKKKWGQLTEDDLKFANGNIDQLVGRIQHKTGEAREAIESFLDELTSHGASAVSQAADSVRNYAGVRVRTDARWVQPDFRPARTTVRRITRPDSRKPGTDGRRGIRSRRGTWGRGRLGIALPLSRRSFDDPELPVRIA